MSVVKGYYNEELFGKAIGQENVSCPIECNMDEDNIEYYIGDNTYPNIISKEELKLKCKENKISYNVLINITMDIKDAEEKITDLTSEWYKLITPTNIDTHIDILDLNKLSLDEIKEELSYVINCFNNIKYNGSTLSFYQTISYKDFDGVPLYYADGKLATYKKLDILSIPIITKHRNIDETTLDILLNILFYNAIKEII